MGRILAAIQQWPLLKNNTTNCRSGGQHGQLRKWCVPTASRPPQDKCILMAPCLRGWHRSTSKANATSGWPQRVAPACGVIGNSSSRKNNSIRIQPGSQQDQRLTWCVPKTAASATPRPSQNGCVPTPPEMVCPPELGVSPPPLARWDGRDCRTSKMSAASGWPQRVASACGEPRSFVVSEKQQLSHPECNHHTGSWSKWCVPAAPVCTALGQTDSDRRAVGVVCPHGQRDQRWTWCVPRAVGLE